MPNWCDNDLTITGPSEDLDRFQAGFIKAGEQPEVDFNFIIPMPTELEETESGGFSHIGHPAWYGDASRILEYPWVKEAGVTSQEELQEFLLKKDPQYKEAADRCQANIEAHGFASWYEWSIHNWGTKWNGGQASFDRQPEQLDITFMTAWSPPEPVILAMSQRFPSLEFELRFYELGAAYQGLQRCRGGELLEEWTSEYHGDKGG